MMISQLPLAGVDKRRRPLPASFILRSVNDAWKYRRAIESFVTNNLRRRYRRSALGFLWGLLGPLLTMTTMAIVFSTLFHAEITTYTFYVFSGLLPWSYLCDSAIEGSQCFVGGETFLKKLFIPKLFFPIVSAGP